MKAPPDAHYWHRSPAEIISLAVWLYHVFSLSFRDVELIPAESGIIVSHKTAWQWCGKFGWSFADRVRRRRPGSAFPVGSFIAIFVRAGICWPRATVAQFVPGRSGSGRGVRVSEERDRRTIHCESINYGCHGDLGLVNLAAHPTMQIQFSQKQRPRRSLPSAVSRIIVVSVRYR
jgi:putative transposase